MSLLVWGVFVVSRSISEGRKNKCNALTSRLYAEGVSSRGWVTFQVSSDSGRPGAGQYREELYSSLQKTRRREMKSTTISSNSRINDPDVELTPRDPEFDPLEQ